MAVIKGRKKGKQYSEDFLMKEASTSVSFTGVMSAVTFFVMSILVVRYSEELFVPLLYLFISAFGFVYSTLIYANAVGQLSRLEPEKAERTLSIGNVISEYFGVYYLVFAFPIAFLAVTRSVPLSASVLAVDVAGFIFYHVPGYLPGSFSILERYLAPRYPTKFVYISLSVLCSLLLTNYVSHVLFFESPSYIYLVFLSTALVILSTVWLAQFCLRRTERPEREF